MTYQKVLIDNPTCSRRFHITFDTDQPAQVQAKASCPFCGVVVFDEPNHPPVKIARQENLIKTQFLSDRLISQCEFKDTFSKPADAHLSEPAKP